MSEVFKLLLVKGYDGVSITDIQHATGLSRGLLYHYFGNKEKMFVEVTIYYCLKMFEFDIEEAKRFNLEEMIDSAVERFGDILKISLKNFPSGDGVTIKDFDFLFYQVIQHSEEFCRQYNRLREDELMVWNHVIRNSKVWGDIRADIDDQKCASYFMFLMDGVWMNTVNNNTPEILVSTLRETLVDYWNLLR